MQIKGAEKQKKAGPDGSGQSNREASRLGDVKTDDGIVRFGSEDPTCEPWLRSPRAPTICGRTARCLMLCAGRYD